MKMPATFTSATAAVVADDPLDQSLVALDQETSQVSDGSNSYGSCRGQNQHASSRSRNHRRADAVCRAVTTATRALWDGPEDVRHRYYQIAGA